MSVSGSLVIITIHQNTLGILTESHNPKYQILRTYEIQRFRGGNRLRERGGETLLNLRNRENLELNYTTHLNMLQLQQIVVFQLKDLLAIL